MKKNKQYYFAFFLLFSFYCSGYQPRSPGENFNFIFPKQLETDDEFTWKIAYKDAKGSDEEAGYAYGFIFKVSKEIIVDREFQMVIQKEKPFPFHCNRIYEYKVNDEELKKIEHQVGKNVYLVLGGDEFEVKYIKSESIVQKLSSVFLLIIYPISKSYGFYPFCRINLKVVQYYSK